MSSPRIAVVGAGLIGQRHVQHVARSAALHSIVDPDASADVQAEQHQVDRYSDLNELLSRDPPDGVIIATPTPLHYQQAMSCIAAGIPALIEKPITSDSDQAARLVAAAAQADVPLLVGHHRRYNPIIAQAREMINAGRLGTLVSVNAMCWLYKPDNYFDATWRREKGAGPILTNLIHDIDLLRFLCGDISYVQAAQSSSVRGFENEDTAAILLGFTNGTLGTVTVTDTVVAPWSWELTAGENRAYPHTNQSAYMIGGTRGSLSLPDLGLWHNGERPGWWEPIARETTPIGAADPLDVQVKHFADVILGQATPIVSGAQGLATLRVIDAIMRAAQTSDRIDVSADA